MQYTVIACIALPCYIYTAAWNTTLTPRAMIMTDRKLGISIQQALIQGFTTGYDLHFTLLHIGDKGIQQSCATHPELLENAAEFFNHINNIQPVIDRHNVVLHAITEQHDIKTRYSAWHQYHIAALKQMNRLLKEQIPTITTYDTELYLVYMGDSILTLNPDQKRSIYRHIVTYGLLLSYIDGQDEELFKKKFCRFPYFYQPQQKCNVS